ncbi:MAG: hypothetical protein A4E39_00653 [Methanoregulaceae archaeon PtaB.Bin152]|nr:MAG: hypothetical protein A4E39_00653 [Methanoregulaceae archaeon PtaB.Bin152]
MQKEPDTTNFCGEYAPDFSLPFTQGMEIRDWGDTPVNGRWDSRMGEILLQFLLAHQVLSCTDCGCQSDFFRQFLAPFNITVHDVDIHILERTTLGGDEVTIGSFYLCFERGGAPAGKSVAAQGLYTVRCNDSDTWVKFTSSTYQFRVHIRGPDPASVTITHNGQVIETGPLPSGQTPDLTSS